MSYFYWEDTNEQIHKQDVLRDITDRIYSRTRYSDGGGATEVFNTPADRAHITRMRDKASERVRRLLNQHNFYEAALELLDKEDKQITILAEKLHEKFKETIHTPDRWKEVAKVAIEHLKED